MTKQSVVDSKFVAIEEAICYWLGYQTKIGREQLIHEASLRYPIADAITAKGININRVELEKRHPIFKHKRIDLVVFNKKVDDSLSHKDNANLEEIYEFKIVNKETCREFSAEHQRIFDDIVRLAYYNLWYKKKCYFIICGKIEEFKAYFVGQNKTSINDGRNTVRSNNKLKNTNTTKGLYSALFNFNINQTVTAEFDTTSADFGLKSFQERYMIREEVDETCIFQDKINITTKCMAITPLSSNINRTHAAGIWKIEII